jgi:hypothetical protein
VEEPLSELRRLGRFTIYLSKLRKHEDAQYDGSHFNHFVNHGFVLAEHAQLKALFQRPQLRAAVDGVVVRIVRQRSPWDDVPAALECTKELEIRLAFQVRLAGDNPAELLTDDLDTANRVGETIVVGLAYPEIDIVFDTFDDIDRGYFSRNGLVDRRSNPHPAGWVYRNLHSALKDMPKLKLGQRKQSTVGAVCHFEAGSRRCALILPATQSTPVASIFDGDGEDDWIDLVTGVRSRAANGIRGNPVLWLQRTRGLDK